MTIPLLQRRQKVEGNESETDTTREIPLGHKLPVEFTTIKKSSEDGNGKRIVTKRMKVVWTGGSHTFFMLNRKLYFVDTQALQWEPRNGKKKGYWKLQYEESYCEPLRHSSNIAIPDAPTRSTVVSLILRDETMQQLITIAQTILPIQITRTMAITAAVFSVMAGLFTLAISPSIAPTTVVHWLTSPPKVIP